MTLIRSIVANNVGGGLHNTEGNMTLIGSTVANNTPPARLET